MKKLKVLFTLLMLMNIDTAGQSGYRVHINNINLPINNHGDLAAVNIPDIDPQISGSTAKLDNITCFFAGGFYLSGYSDTTLWVNGEAYSGLIQDYIPGKYGTSPDDPKNKIYVVRKSDPSFGSSWQEWGEAVLLGAMYYDGNGDGIYNPIDNNGNMIWDPSEDKPDLIGDLTAWCVYNDGKPANQRRYEVEPQGIEIHQTVFAYDSANSDLANTIFIRYRIINRNTSIEKMDSVIFGLWADHDIGGSGDENFGSDTLLNSIFGYNDGDDFDYGVNPPALFLTYLQFPYLLIPGETYVDLNGNNFYDEGIDTPLDTVYSYLGKDLGVKTIPGAKNSKYGSATGWINAHPVLTDPINKAEARNYLSGTMRSGEMLDPCTSVFTSVEGNINCAEINPFFWASGDPVNNSGWLWKQAANGRILSGTSVFDLVKDKPVDIIAAYTAVRGADELNSITVTKEKVRNIIKHYNSNFGANPLSSEENKQVIKGYHLYQNYPNPFNPTTKLSFVIDKLSLVNLKVYDILGNEIATLVNKELSAGEHSISFSSLSYGLSSGIYFYQLNAGGKIYTKKMILQK